MSDIIFNVIDWNSKDDIEDEEEETDESSFVIEAFGKTKDNQSVYLKINNFTPYFYVEIPKRWQDMHIKKFLNHIKVSKNAKT